ncbi:hypothetical protein N7G274_009311 [Stereocaulon virgatum]|uniref:IgE-binding protein n=1 Tax=Stereocaulon virgatum TaxID=373712 RepID=A0ABR3ZW50_9LECA
MLSTTILSLLLPLTLINALPTNPRLQPRQNTATAPFTLIAARSTSPIHLQPINANNATFWIGKPTHSYCIPEVPPADCPPGTETALTVGDGRASMDSEVPGGQDVYISAINGALSFTEPHTEGGENGTTTGFSYTNRTDGSLGEFVFSGLNATGFVACPSLNGSAPWQIFAALPHLCDADVPGKNVSACLGFDALGDTYPNGTAAWQYE